MLQINPFLDCTVYSGIVVHIGRNSHDTTDKSRKTVITTIILISVFIIKVKSGETYYVLEIICRVKTPL
jgi:hypothetical protein